MPTKAECLDAAAEIFLREVIRIEQEKLDHRVAESAAAAALLPVP